MPKKLYTANDIVNLVRDQHLSVLMLNKSDLITPMARDIAREMGLEIVEAGAVLPPDTPQVQGGSPAASAAPASDLEAKVRTIVAAMVGQNASAPQPTAACPVMHVDGRGLTMPAFPFDIHRPEMDVRLEDVITAQHGAPMAAGFLSMHKGSFPWTLTYDEIQYVVEGELHIVTEQGTIVGKPGDVLYIPKNTSIHFSTPSWAKFFYVTYPAEWGG
jgi:ethanolamine utilization protein EutQ